MTKVRFGNNPFMTADFRNIFNDINRNTKHPRRHYSSVQSAVNILETKNATEIHIALPGVDKENVDIKLDRDILNVSVNSQEKKINNDVQNVAVDNENVQADVKVEPTTKYKRKEFDFSQFKRSFSIPETIDLKKIGAQFKNGVLIIELSKKKEVVIEPQRISIK